MNFSSYPGQHTSKSSDFRENRRNCRNITLNLKQRFAALLINNNISIIVNLVMYISYQYHKQCCNLSICSYVLGYSQDHPTTSHPTVHLVLFP